MSVARGLGGAAVAIGLLYWMVAVRSAPTSVVAHRQCERALAAARTAADSLAADSIPVVGARHDSVPLTCAVLRAGGR